MHNLEKYYDKLRANGKSDIADIPVGWMEFKLLVHSTIYLLVPRANEEHFKLKYVETSDGFLRMVYDSGDIVTRTILDRLCWSIERTTAVTCQVCGERARRRVLSLSMEEGLPRFYETLCHTHYINRLNELDNLHEQSAKV